MKYIIIPLTSLIIACNSSPKKPSLEEANELFKNLNKPDTTWTTFPKRFYTGGDGVFIIHTEKDDQSRQVRQAGEQAGVWNVVQEAESTGEYFFSVEKRNFYDRIEPATGYEYLFTDNPNNPDEWRLLLSTQEKSPITNVAIKKDPSSKKSPGVPIGFYQLKIEKTPLYDIFRTSNSSIGYPYIIFKKVDSKWTIDGQSSMNESEAREILGENLINSASNEDCLVMHNGKFKILDGSGEYFVNDESSNIQMGYSSNGTQSYKSKIHWINNCEYTLTTLETYIPNKNHSDFIQIRITRYENGIFYYSWKKKGDSYHSMFAGSFEKVN